MLIIDSKFGSVLYNNVVQNIAVKFLFSFHNPKAKRYTLYYSIVLVVVTVTVLFTTLEYIHQTIIQGIATFFEGFFSLFMLARNEKVGKAFLFHLVRIRDISK